MHHSIENKGKDDPDVINNNKSNNKLTNDYPGYIVGLSTGYFMGKPIAYSIKDGGNEEYMQKLQDIFDANDEADIDSEIAKTCSIQGEAFELEYIDKNSQPAFAQLKNEETLLVYNNDINPKPILGIRHYVIQTPFTIDSITTEKVVVYTNQEILYYDYNVDGLVLTDYGNHYFGKVPIVVRLIHQETYNNVNIGTSEQTVQYYLDVPEQALDELSLKQEMILHCIYSRSCDGFVRQKHLKLLLLMDYDDWTISYIVKLCDEYIIEILEMTYDILKKGDTERIKRFCLENVEPFCKSYARMISYWNEFYRDRCYNFHEYIGRKLFRECFGYSGILERLK